MNQELILLTIKFATVYFVIISIIYSILLYFSWLNIKRTKNTKPSTKDEGISFIVPIFNEESLVVESIQTYLKMNLQKEVILVNDGSSDHSFDLLINMFQFKKVEINFFHSITHPELKLLNLPHAGKAHALNAGVGKATFEYICTIDADTIPNEAGVIQSLHRMNNDPQVMALGGVIHIIPQKGLINFLQRIEYLRTFICERLGWSILEATTLISGAFCIFRKSGWKQINGFREDSITEDLDFIIRLRREFKNHKFPIIAQSTCLTQVPRTWSHLRSQRIRWHIGLLETLKQNLFLTFNPSYGSFSILGLSYLLFVEALSPILQTLMWIMIPYSLYQGWLELDFVLIFLGAGFLYSSFLTLVGLRMDIHPKKENALKVILGSLVLSFGYKQITGLWRLFATFKILGTKSLWGIKPRYEITETNL